jgi:hypothetical protein
MPPSDKGWTIGISGFDFRQRQENFHVSETSEPALVASQFPLQWELMALFPGVKKPGRETGH